MKGNGVKCGRVRGFWIGMHILVTRPQVFVTFGRGEIIEKLLKLSEKNDNLGVETCALHDCTAWFARL
jgi:hypothetical protein